MEKFLWYFEKGGILMYPIALASIISLAVIVERFIRLQRKKLISFPLVETVQSNLESGKMEEAMQSCSGKEPLVASVLESALKEYSTTETDIETAFQESGQRGLQVLWNNLAVLSTVARIAPLMGLLGTVCGMIGAFEVLSVAGVGKEEMADQIRIALITTASGLIVAIPTVVAEAFFRSKIRKVLALFDDIFINVMKSVRIGMEVSGKKKVSAANPKETEDTKKSAGKPDKQD